MPTYIKHYWTDSVGNYQSVANQSVDRRHPNLDGLAVKYWLKDERGVDYCLSVCPDTTLIETPPVGIEVLTKSQWDEIVASIPPAPPEPEQPKPDWETFRSSIATSPEMQYILGEAIKVNPQAVVSLTTAVYQLDSGDYYYFQTSWNQIQDAYNASLVIESPNPEEPMMMDMMMFQPEISLEEVKNSFKALAQSCNLPGDFISLI
jgi:hypothetical protein